MHKEVAGHLSNLALAIAATIVGLLLGEIGLWLVAPQTMRDEHNAYAGVPGTPYYQLRPNYRRILNDRVGRYTFTTNSYGIRDVEFDPAEPHSRRVLFLGDSQTMGYGVDLEQSFVKQFESNLRKTSHQDWQALNLAIAGGSTFDESYSYRAKGMVLAHQYVILGFYVGNDIADNTEFQTRPNNAERPGVRTFAQGARLFMAQHSQIWNLLVNRLNAPIFYKLGIKHGPGPFLDAMRTDEPASIRHGWQLTFRALQELQALVASRHAELMILAIPHKVQLRDAALESAALLYGVSSSTLDIGRPQRILRKFANEENIPLIDLIDYLKPDERLYYFDSDIHLNAGGHAAIGEILARVFLARHEGHFPGLTSASSP